MIFNVTGWLWRFVWFRFFVLSWCRAGWWGSDWLAVNTPFLFALRALLDVRPGNADLVARIDAALKGSNCHVG